jgi:hypothetical protein
MWKLVWSLESRREWSIASKAALGSSETSIEGWLHVISSLVDVIEAE